VVGGWVGIEGVGVVLGEWVENRGTVVWGLPLWLYVIMLKWTRHRGRVACTENLGLLVHAGPTPDPALPPLVFHA